MIELLGGYFGAGFEVPPSARIAADRLHHITRRDRAACGDGRWVHTGYGIRLRKGHWRWEPRR